MKTLGMIKPLCDMSYESEKLLEWGEEIFDEVILINPLRVTYSIKKDISQIKIIHQGRDISGLSALIVRNTKSCPFAISVLVKALKSNGCFIGDPSSRFSGAMPSKAKTTINRHEKGIGVDSYYAFNHSDAMSLLDSIDEYPLIAKPIRGCRSNGVEVIQDRSEAREYINNFPFDDPIFFQKMEHLVKEYRAIVIGNVVVGMVKKVMKKDRTKISGKRFVRVKNSRIKRLIEEYMKDNEGILGLDIGMKDDRSIFVIEANRAPMWQRFEEISGIDIAKLYIRYVYASCE